jgi:signal transduction histidine kinase
MAQFTHPYFLGLFEQADGLEFRSMFKPFASNALRLAAFCFCCVFSSSGDDLHTLSLSRLEQRLAAVDAELTTLARYNLRSDTGAVGYRSNSYKTEFQREWIQIDFESPHRLDEIVVVPMIRRDARDGFQADGFPKHFRVIAGTAGDPTGQVIATYTNAQEFLPRIAPLCIPCEGITASWIRIEADRLSLRSYDRQFVFQLSEIMAFSGEKNVALHQSVTSGSNWRDEYAWDKRFAVDGFVPYMMDAAEGERSVAFVCRIAEDASPTLTVDLGAPTGVSRLHLHAIETSDFIPQPYGLDFGIPRRMRLEGANRPDFADAETLLDLHLDSIYDMSPLMMWSFPEATCRYLRLRILTPPDDPLPPPKGPRFGFAEIELFGNNGNILAGKEIKLSGTMPLGEGLRTADLLTNGRNIYGNILPLREWMRQLARRHDLEAERPRIESELRRRYKRQAVNVRFLGWLSALLAAGIGFTILMDRLLRLRQVRRMEQRIAADLHDELGANLHTIGLLSDLAENAKNNPDQLAMHHQRIRAVTERSGIAVRNCTNMFASKALYEGLIVDMQRVAQRIMANLDHELSIEGEEYIHQLRPRTCFDLFLFYKECLVNISRHSGATRFSTRLKITPREIQLTVSDNGRGFTAREDDGIPASLKRRAKLLGAQLISDTPPDGGAVIHLNLKLRKQRRFF